MQFRARAFGGGYGTGSSFCLGETRGGAARRWPFNFLQVLATGQIRALALGGRTVVRADELAMFAEGLPQLAFKAPTAARKKQSSGS